MQIGRKIYYEVLTGNVLVDTGERQGSVRPTTAEQDIAAYKVLSELNRETFDVLELEYGQYAQDFTQANGYHVNPETKALVFSYPDPNAEPEAPAEPVYQVPLSEEVALLKAQNEELQIATMDLGNTVAAQEALLQEQQVALLDLANTLAEVTANG